jgi:uncharacterized damage-inducible protein DinB
VDSLTTFTTARAATLQLVAPLRQEQFDFRAKPTRWSVGEIVDHLLLAEALYRREISALIDLKRAGKRPYLRRSFDDVNVSPFGLPDAFLPWLGPPLTLANVFLPSFLRELAVEYAVIPMRSPGPTTPRPRRPAGDLRAELLASSDETRRLLAANADLDYREMVSEHPLTGASSIPDMLTFLARHERRHQRQIAAVRSDLRFPSS